MKTYLLRLVLDSTVVYILYQNYCYVFTTKKFSYCVQGQTLDAVLSEAVLAFPLLCIIYLKGIGLVFLCNSSALLAINTTG